MVQVTRMGGSALIIAAMATALAGCSTKPRNFAASVSTPVADRNTFEQDYRTCDSLVRAGHSSNFKGAAASGLAGAAGTFGTTAAFAYGGGIGIGGASTAASMAIPGVGIIAALGMSRAIRGGKERKLKANMTACLNEYGYEVADWEKLKKRDDAAAAAASRVTVFEPEVMPQEPEEEPANEAELVALTDPGL